MKIDHRVLDPMDVAFAMRVQCPICNADEGCLCDQFTAPHELPFHVHIERLGKSLDTPSKEKPGELGVKPCPDCGRELRHRRTLTGPLFKNGRCEVWTHVDTGYSPCNVDANGMEIMPSQQVYVLFQEVSDQYGTSEPIGVFAHELAEEEQRKLSPSKRSYVKKFEVQP
jgi:hypothetical protein